jgi:cytochrome c biogenesis protein CcdA
MQETVLALLEAHSYLAFLGAFGAGALTAAAPCSLVTVPLLVGSAVALNSDLSGHKKVLYTYLFASLFALGVMISFSALGFAVAKFGALFSVAPFWAYLAAGGLSIAIAFYALGIIPAVDKSGVMRRLIEFRLFGAFVIGIVFGLVSTPCASAPLVAIIGAAAESGYLLAYGLILTFALGHSLLLLAAGISVGFAQSVVSSQTLARVSEWLNKGFALVLLGFGGYFIYQAVLQF